MLKIIILSVTVGLFFYPLSFTGKEFKKENEISKINQTNLSDLKNVDLGRNTKPGDCSIKDNQITIKAGGADIWGTKDEGFFTYTKILGDFEVSVKIVNLEKTHLYTKAGIMARSDLSEDSKHIFFQIFPDNSPRNKNNGGSEFQYRAEKGAEMEAIYPDIETAGNKFDVNFPNTWIRLKRTNNVFESYSAMIIKPGIYFLPTNKKCQQN